MFNVRLEEDWLRGKGRGRVGGETIKKLIDNRSLSLPADLPALRDLVNLDAMDKLSKLGAAAAEEQVMDEDFPAVFDDIWTPAIHYPKAAP